MAKIEPFEKYCDEYDKWFENNSAIFETELEALRELIPFPEAEGIEIGVGSGKFAAPLGIKIGLDPSEKMANKARKRGITITIGIAEKIPFHSERFDFVLMVTAICFFDDIRKSFKEAFRILKPDGCIIIGFIDKKSKLGKKYAENKSKSKFYKHAIFYSAEDVIKNLKLAGFKIEKIRQTLIPEQSSRTIIDDFGQGAFIVLKAIKINPKTAV